MSTRPTTQEWAEIEEMAAYTIGRWDAHNDVEGHPDWANRLRRLLEFGREAMSREPLPPEDDQSWPGIATPVI